MTPPERAPKLTRTRRKTASNPLQPRKAVAHLLKCDAKLVRLIQRVGPCTLKPQRDQSPFHALLRSIIFQQLHGKAAATIHGRLRALYPGEIDPTPEELLRTPDETLRGVGLSRNKLAAIKDLAEKTLDGTVPSIDRIEDLSDREIIDRLTVIRGIGPWTVEMMLIFKLGRTDVLPVTDFGVRKGFMITYGLKEMPSAQQMSRKAEAWRPYRSIASWYLWRAADLAPAQVAKTAQAPKAAKS